MDSPVIPRDLLHAPSLSATAACTVLFLYAVHHVLAYFDLALPAPQELLWNALVYSLPTPLLLDGARRQELRDSDMLAQTHAAKSEALRRMLGFGSTLALQSLSSAGQSGGGGIGGIMRRASTSVVGGGLPRGNIPSDTPPGLGNWDNSCYQNSVLQALASITSLRSWLGTSGSLGDGNTTNSSLHETIAKLKDPSNNGRHIWTPAKLKNMSSWQQQDAQEYFSKIMDELDKDAARTAAAGEVKQGLETLAEEAGKDADARKGMEVPPRTTILPHNPLEGLAAQRITCTSCGFSEGFSMIPFNCLTVPLGSSSAYDLDECLDVYTKREEIEGVECRCCTLLHTSRQLIQLSTPKIPPTTDSNAAPALSLPPELRAQIAHRLHAIEAALATDDFSDKTLKETCQIAPKSLISSTKTREALIGRAPRSLVVHVNRSVFDELTGAQRKNYAQVRYPYYLDLRPWMLDVVWGAARVGVGNVLRAVVTHYGRHENGHYICYRKHPRAEEGLAKVGREEGWWRLSDEDVSPVSEEDVLGQGGVFMLFYEREDERPLPLDEDVAQAAAAVPLPADDLSADFEETSDDDTADLSVLHSTPPPPPEDSARAAPIAAEEFLQPPASAPPSIATESDTDAEDDAERSSTAPQSLPPAPLLRTASPQFQRHARGPAPGRELGMSRPLMRV